MLLFQFALTMASVTTVLLIAGLALAERRWSRSKVIFILLAISNSGLMIDALPSALGLPHQLDLFCKLLAIPNVGLIWWLALSVCDDRFQLNSFAWAGMLLSSVGRIFWWLSDSGLIAGVPELILGFSALFEGALFLHMLWVGVSSYKDDLIEPRREARIWIAALIVVTLGVMIVAQQVMSSSEYGLLRAGLVLPLSILAVFALAQFRSHSLDFAKPSDRPQPQNGIEAKDQQAHGDLLEFMTKRKPYLDSDLSIATLSEQVSIPTHRLRRIINQGMGFRNFSSFLAHYRIADVQAALADPQQARTQILTIALDHGFSSISTFNRVFKAETSQTASAYREQALKACNTVKNN